jgi:ABC-2 type transport system permease protein
MTFAAKPLPSSDGAQSVTGLAHSSMPTQVGLLAGRAIKRILRNPAQMIFPVMFPLILLGVNASGLDAATKLPGFPTASYLDFALAIPFMQGALFAALNGGQDLARDIQGGFLDRLAMTPMSGAALLAGQLGGALFMGVLSATIYLLVGLLFGVGIAAGVGGAFVLLLLAIAISFAFACFGTFVALRAGTGEAVQGFFPLFFVLLFLSSAFFPRNLIEQDWFRTIATYNPVSYMVEGIRSLVITGWDGQALAQAFGIAAIAIVFFLALSARALRTRLVRT